MKLDDLKKEIPYKWRVQSYSKYKPQASCVAYIDARDAMDLLDEVCGPENWQLRYKEACGLLFAEVGIKIIEKSGEVEYENWVFKSDTGSESNMEKDKGHASDAFKRACVHWGIGRFLYSLKIKYVTANEKKEGNNYPFPIDSSNQRVWDLTKHFKNTADLKDHKPKLKDVQYKAMIAELSKGVYTEVELRMKNYDLTLEQEDNLLNAINEVKSLNP